MKQFVIILLISLWIPIVSHSQTTYPIIRDSLIVMTPPQLKTTNLIFNEHEMLIKKVSLLVNQVLALDELNKTYVAQDSIRLKEVDLYKNAYIEKESRYNILQEKFKQYKTYSIFGSIATFVLGVLICR